MDIQLSQIIFAMKWAMASKFLALFVEVVVVRYRG